MKKNKYQVPMTKVVKVELQKMMAGSVINPGEDNAPAGSRQDSWGDED